MGGSTRQTQTTNAQSQTDPWAPTMPALQGIVSQLQGHVGNAGLTGTETGALNTLTAGAQQGNPYAGRVGMLADDLLTGGTDRTGMVSGAYDDLRASLTPFARGDYVDPSKNPALQGYLSTISNDVQNRVNGMFAGAGRDLSGMNQQTLARGIAEGTAPTLLNAYEGERGRQFGAIDALYSGGVGTAGMLSNMDQTMLGNRQAGIDTSSAALQARDSPANQLLQIEAQRRGIPVQNLGMLTNILAPIAQLGGSSNSTSTTVGESQQPLGQQILGGAIGGLGLLGGLGGFGPTGWLYGSGKNSTGLLNNLFSR